MGKKTKLGQSLIKGLKAEVKTLQLERKAIEEIKNRDISAPWEVSRFTGCKAISIAGDQASIGQDSDYGSVEEIQNALNWLVDQFGGKITWSK